MNGIYPERRRRSFDSIWAGALLGVVLPFVIFLIIYKSRFPDESFDKFIEIAAREGMVAPLLSLSIVPNLGLFFLGLKFDKLNTARGVILATLLYGIPIFTYKFFV